MQLNGRVYVVTGGSRGFGLAIAKSLVASGARVGLLSRNRSGLEQAVAEIGSDHAYAVAADIGHREHLATAFADIAAHFGRFDGLVNNAGMARPSRIEELREDEVLMQVNTNYLGTVFACQAAIPLLRGGENPRIVNISSASAVHFDEMCNLSIYASTKAAVERFTRELAIELTADGIGVTCVRPGGSDTSFASDWDAERFSAGIDAWLERGTYMHLGMGVEQVAEAVAFSLSQPPGVAVDLLEIRPNQRFSKAKLFKGE